MTKEALWDALVYIHSATPDELGRLLVGVYGEYNDNTGQHTTVKHCVGVLYGLCGWLVSREAGEELHDCEDHSIGCYHAVMTRLGLLPRDMTRAEFEKAFMPSRAASCSGSFECCCHTVAFSFGLGGHCIVEETARILRDAAMEHATDLISRGYPKGDFKCAAFDRDTGDLFDASGSWHIETEG